MERKSAFHYPYGYLKYIVLPYEITNATATFEHFINIVLWEDLDIFSTAFIKDIVIY